MPSVEINWVALLAAAVINMAIGGLWWSPFLFGGYWRRLSGKRGGTSTNGSRGYAIALAGSYLLAFVLVHFIRYAGALTVWRGVQVGFWLWLMLGLLTVMVAALDRGGKLWRLWQIGAGYSLVVLLINGGLLAAWR